MMEQGAVSLFITASIFLPSVSAIRCFECDSSKNFSCTEYWDSSLEVITDFITDCNHVFEAQYCVKMTGIFEGKLGTKRFCSSRDWGYYCEYIKRPGDIQEYRSCIYSCTTDECNSATNLTSSKISIISTLILIFVRSMYKWNLFWNQNNNKEYQKQKCLFYTKVQI